MKITLTNRLTLAEPPETLRDELRRTLTLPNPRWLENERMGRWNRNTPKILKFYTQTRSGNLIVPRGCIRMAISLCRQHGVAYTIDDRRRMLPPGDFSFQGTLRPFQTRAVTAMLAREFGTLSAPTGSGKTVMALHIIAIRRQPTLIIVHTKELAFQWIDRIEAFLGIPATEVGLIGGGKLFVGSKVTVALVQSLYKCAATVSPRIGHIVVDECHRTPSRTVTEAVVEFDARYMLGLSATPWRRDKLSKLIFWHLGDVHWEVAKTALVESGDVLPAEVIVRETDFKPYVDPVREYSKMLSELAADDRRNRMIAQDVAQEAQAGKGVCLVLSDRKSHCENLQAMLRYRHRLPAELLTGNLKVDQRREILERLRRGEVKVLIATGQLIGEGFDYEHLSPLFLVTPIRFSGRLLQYLGRVLRPAPGKQAAKVYDYVDVHVDVLRAAAQARQRIYAGKSR